MGCKPERLAREERPPAGLAFDAPPWEEILQAAEKVRLARAQAKALVA